MTNHKHETVERSREMKLVEQLAVVGLMACGLYEIGEYDLIKDLPVHKELVDKYVFLALEVDMKDDKIKELLAARYVREVEQLFEIANKSGIEE